MSVSTFFFFFDVFGIDCSSLLYEPWPNIQIVISIPKMKSDRQFQPVVFDSIEKMQ